MNYVDVLPCGHCGLPRTEHLGSAYRCLFSPSCHWVRAELETLDYETLRGLEPALQSVIDAIPLGTDELAESIHYRTRVHDLQRRMLVKLLEPDDQYNQDLWKPQL